MRRKSKPTIEENALDSLFGLGSETDEPKPVPKRVRQPRPQQKVEPAEPEPEKPKKTARKRKPKVRHSRQMSAILYEDQIEWLEGAVKKMKKNGGTTTRKANVMRALIDLAMESKLSFSDVETEDDLKKSLVEAINNK